MRKSITMARQTDLLTAARVRQLISAGTCGSHHDGGGLYLIVSGVDVASWLFKYGAQGRKSMSFGPARDVSLVAARAKRQAARALLADDRDPRLEREQIRAAAKVAAAQRATFGQACDAFHANHEASWRSPKHSREWKVSLQTHAADLIPLPVSAIDTTLVLKVIEPIWKKKTQTASRVRQRIEAVLDFCRARGWREGDNPARWKGHLENILPKPRKIAPVKHYAALPFCDVPAFMARLRQIDSTAARALEFAILSASRSGEARRARLDQTTPDSKTWLCPPEIMKRKKPHRAALSAAAAAIVERQRTQISGPYLFPGRGKLPIGDTALNDLLAELAPGVTVHGFRTAFRQWAGDMGYPRELAEAALSHQIAESNTEQAYLRDADLLDRRRPMMEAWASYVGGKKSDNIVMLKVS
jgi:integrase